jgi:hypothetical protein
MGTSAAEPRAPDMRAVYGCVLGCGKRWLVLCRGGRNAPSRALIELSGSIAASLGLPQGNVKNQAFVA